MSAPRAMLQSAGRVWTGTLLHACRWDESGEIADGCNFTVAFAAGGWDTLEAAGVVPVEKTLVVDMAEAVGYPHAKMEGLWLIDQQRLGMLNDDGFALWSRNNTMEQKYLDSTNRIDAVTLYVIEDLDLTAN